MLRVEDSRGRAWGCCGQMLNEGGRAGLCLRGSLPSGGVKA